MKVVPLPAADRPGRRERVAVAPELPATYPVLPATSCDAPARPRNPTRSRRPGIAAPPPAG